MNHESVPIEFKYQGEHMTAVGTLHDQAVDALDAVMLKENSVPNLLTTDIRRFDQAAEIEYSIGSRKPLYEWLRLHKVSELEALQLILHLTNSLLQLHNYLLSEDRCLLQAEWMFVGEHILDVQLIYWPSADMEPDREHLARRLQHLCLQVTHHASDMKAFREIVRYFDDPSFTLQGLRRRLIHLVDHYEAGDHDHIMQSDPDREAGSQGSIINLAKQLFKRGFGFRSNEKGVAEGKGRNAAHVTIPLRASAEKINGIELIYIDNRTGEQHNPKHQIAEHPSVVEYQSEIFGPSEVGQRNERIPVTKLPFILGRDRHLADWTSEDTKLSRAHAELKRSADGYVVRDLGSRNGTYRNGERLMPFKDYELENGDRIELADHRFQFHVDRP